MKHRQTRVPKLNLTATCLMLVLIVPLLAACNFGKDHLLFTYKAERRCMWSADGAAETPVIIGDTIYYLGGYPWNNQIFLHAVDKRTGKEIWSTTDGIQEFEVNGESIFVVGRPNLFKREPGRQQESWLKAIASKDGKALWRTNSLTDWRGVHIVAAKELLFVLANSGLSAINKENGTIAWESEEELFADVEPNVLVYKDYLIAQLANRSIGFFENKTGKLVDKLELPKLDNRLPRVMQIYGDFLVVANGDGTILIADAEKRDNYGIVDVGWINSKITATDQRLYFCSGPMPNDVREVLHGAKPETDLERSAHFNVLSAEVDARKKRQEELEQQKETRLNAFDLGSGKVLWQSKFEEKGQKFTAPVGGGEFVAAGVEGPDSSMVLSIEKSTGKIVSKTKIGTPISNPVFADGNIIVRGGDSLNAIDPKTGKILFSYKPRDMGLDGSPVADNSVVYIGGKDSNLYAFEANKFGE